ncbi:FxSxx-COOH system tetratricopeptide repeat protein [Pseudofrankia inefficax]|uniref:NB-ARC domain protein n=1 Tax=Pseudofrankia inefficax (strain DSM 45817 / CECT 9037 / DDB 130130 / EuI1c) TaxID=298654 RepID=E3IVJ1_PSEI1|nr:FxSxx-COOH system tetratricopeptide repeat protein [Pseudofrankia inefficax]ADP82497.1 NB-ARC domain protein [Pseudofrankia inefficax]
MGGLSAGEVAEFAKVFPDLGSAGRVLAASGVPMERLPSWAVTDALGFWSAVSGLLANGLTEGGPAALCAAAVELFPANPVFRAGAAHSGAPVGDVVWSLPWPRNPHFTGREVELSELRSRLVGDGRAVTMPQALHGLGGVGKTQLAVQYAYRHAGDYDLVWWVPAEDPALVLAALVVLAEQVGLAVAGQAEESASEVVNLLRQGRRFPRWLVILDNADAPEDLFGLLSAAGGGGHVLITTRDSGWSRLAGTVGVDVLPRDKSVVFLRERVPRLSVVEAGQIAAAVADLPLALEQAGAWLAETGTPAGVYVDLLNERVSEVMARGVPVDHAPVAATWTVVLRALDESTILLARLWALFGPEPIPVDLIRPEVADLLPPPLNTTARDRLAFRDIVGKLVRTATVRLVAGDMIVMHRLVQSVLVDDMPDRLRPVLLNAARGLLACAHPKDSTRPDGWRWYAQLYPHALAVDLVGADSDEARGFVLALSWALREQGDYPTSRRLLEQAHGRWMSFLGAYHPDTLWAASNLVATLASLGNYPAARILAGDVLIGRRGVLGDDHPDTIRAAGNLAITLRNLGDYEGARPLEEDVLTRLRCLLGDDHPDTIRASDNLASTMRDLEDYPAARTLQEDALARWRALLGDDHPSTIRTANNLANTLWSLKEYPAARTLQEDVLARRQRILGDDHPDTVRAAGNLASTLWSLKEYPAARTLQEDVLARRQRILGDDHPETIRAAASLASTLRSLGERPAARALREDVLARRRRLLGDDHVDTIRSKAALADLDNG